MRAHLVVHGLLHLFGHDHADDAEAEAMEALETKVLASMGIANPYSPPGAPLGRGTWTGVMADLPDGHAAVGPQARDDEDPDSPGRSFFSRLFRREQSGR